MAKTKIPIARDLMHTVVEVLRPDMDLLQAIEKLSALATPAAPVVDSERHFRGMLTEKDCLRVLSISAFHRPRGGRVADFMSRVAQAIEPDMDLFLITELFLENNFPMLPVVEGEKLVGCVSRQDMLSGIIGLTQRLASKEVEAEVEAAATEEQRRPRSIEDLQRAFARYTREQLVHRIGRMG